MVHHAVVRRLLLSVVLFRSVGLLAAAPQSAPVQTKASSSQVAIPQIGSDTPLTRPEDLFRKGSFDQAIVGYNEVLKSDPQSAAAYAGIVLCYLKQDNVHNAVEWLAKGLQANSADPNLKEAQGELLFRQGSIPEAEHIFVQLINSGKAPARAYLGLAEVSSAVAMYAREHRLVLRAHELDPSDPDIQKEWIGTLPRAERVKALESYLAESHGDDAETRRSIGEYLEMLKARQSAPGATCRLASDVTVTETDLRPLLLDVNHLRGLGMSVVINDKKSTLLLDTGAGGITINSRLAERAGVRRLSDTHIGGIGDKGPVKGYTAYADSIRIGKLEFRNCLVGVVDKRSVVEEEEGLIGADVFAPFLIEIDFPKRKLNLSPLPARPGEPTAKPSLAIDDEGSGSEPDAKAASGAGGEVSPPAPRYFDRFVSPEMKSYAPIFRFGHMLLIPTKIGEVSDKLFLIDSGAFNNTITPDAAREVTKVHADYDTTVKGVSGKVNKVYETGTVVLEFGGLRQKNVDMTAFDFSKISRDVGTEVSGTIGFPVLNILKLRIDYRDALVNFEYVPNPWMR
jgi:tetratricopeptide (TPR) repeat protein